MEEIKVRLISPTAQLPRGLGADLLAFVIAVMMALGITSVSALTSAYEHETVLKGGHIGVYELDGTPWSIIYFSVKSSQPVTVCITNGNGNHALSSGTGVCLFLAKHVTHISKVWRFPVKGPLYLLIIPEREDTPVSVQVEIRTLLSGW